MKLRLSKQEPDRRLTVTST